MPATASRSKVSSCVGNSGSEGPAAAVVGAFTSALPQAASSWHHVGASRRRRRRRQRRVPRTLFRMSYAEDSPPSLKPRMSQEATALAYEWRKLTRAATAVAVLTSPAWFLVFWKANHWDWYWALLATFVGVIAFRGAVDVISHKLIPAPDLYGAQSQLLEEDIVSRRRVWYWRTMFRRLSWLVLALFVLLVALNLMLKLAGINVALFDTFDQLGQLFTSFLPTLLILG